MKQIQIYSVIRERHDIPYVNTLAPLDGVFVQVSDHRESWVSQWKWWRCKDQPMRRTVENRRVFLVNSLAQAIGLRWDNTKEVVVCLDGDFLNCRDENIALLPLEEVVAQ